MKTLNLFTIIFLSFIFGCNNLSPSASTTKVETTYNMNVIHYYSVKMENGIPVRDTLRECFYCNQGMVKDATGKELEQRFYKSDMKTIPYYEIYQHNAKGQKIGSHYYEASNQEKLLM